MTTTRSKTLHVLLAAALLALVVIPVTLAGAKKQPGIRAQVKTVKRELAAVKAQLAALEQTGSAGGAAGPAGGARAGSYPNPQLANGAVAAANLAPGSVDTPALADDSVTSDKLGLGAVTDANLAPNSVGTAALAERSVTGAKIALGTIARGNLAATSVGSLEIGNREVLGEDIGLNTVSRGNLTADAVGTNELIDGSVFGIDLANGAVGGPNVRNSFAIEGQGVLIEQGQTNEASVSCPGNSRLLGGGLEWSRRNGEDTEVISSGPTFTGDPNHTWVVQGRVDSGASANNTLFAAALCLAG